MDYHNCCKSRYKCKSRKCCKDKERIEFDIKCPPPLNPLPNVGSVDYRRYTVGGGGGALNNEYTTSVPVGTQFITVRVVGAGGGGGGQLSQIYRFTGGLIDIAQPVQGGGGGAAGFCFERNRPYGAGCPATLDISVGAAATVATDPLTGKGNDGGPSIVSFSNPSNIPGWEDVCAFGGRGGGVGRSLGDGSGEAGCGGEGGLGGGGGGELCLLIADPPTIIPGGPGGNSKQGQNGEDGNDVKGGDGATNVGSGSVGVAIPGNVNAGGGGGAANSLLALNSGGGGGPVGDMGTSNAGEDFKIQDVGAPGGGVGLYIPELSEEGSTIFRSGGRGGNGLAEVWFYITTPPS